MSDYLQNQMLREVLKRLGVPVPVPEILKRTPGPISNDELMTTEVALTTTYEHSDWYRSLQQLLNAKTKLEYYPVEADALVIDATAAQFIDDLEKVYSFSNANVKRLNKNGRIVVLSSAVKESSIEAKVASRALDGFVKSLAKEMGGRGITVNMLRLPEMHFALHGKEAADAIWPVLQFFLGQRSSFVTGQILELQSHDIKDLKTTTPTLSGKVALVTGSARGIGAETATFLAREGAKVILLDVPSAKEPLEALARELGGWALPLDITNEAAASTVQKLLKENNTKLDILVNNAGVIRDKTLAKMTPDQWRLVLNVNLKSVMRFTDALLVDGLADNASIVGLSSISGIAGNAGQTNYSASKSGLITYLKEIAAANHYRGITANAIAPGFIETQMTENLPFFVKEGGRRLSALKQGGLPADIAEAIVFLSGNGGKCVTGQVLRVCGGSFLGA